MKYEIREMLESIQNEEGFRILYAAESGSRAWGYPSPGSDYDVRFIYAHEQERYLSIVNRKDFYTPETKDENIDISGWDITKTLKAVNKVNLAPYEWIMSPIVYMERDNFRDELHRRMEKFFNPKLAMFHYINQAGSFLKRLEEKEEISAKNFLYILRPVLTASFIGDNQRIPPVDIDRLIVNFPEQGPELDEIRNILALKEQQEEDTLIQIPKELRDFFQRHLERCEAEAKLITFERTKIWELDKFFRAWIRPPRKPRVGGGGHRNFGDRPRRPRRY